MIGSENDVWQLNPNPSFHRLRSIPSAHLQSRGAVTEPLGHKQYRQERYEGITDGA